MKNIILLLALLVSFNSISSIECETDKASDLSQYFNVLTQMKAKETGKRFELSDFEKTFLDEVNLARSNPGLYADYLREHLTSFNSEKNFKEGGVLYATREGKKAVEEAIAYLEVQKPLQPLKLSEGMTQSGRDHVKELGPISKTGHYSVDGKDPFARIKKYGVFSGAFAENISYSSQSPRGHVIALIVDDGVASRGHRKNIFNSEFKTAGIGCGGHAKFTTMCVMDFAGKFTEQRPGGAILIDEY